MPTPPTRVATYFSGYASSSAARTVVITCEVDDVLVLKASAESGIYSFSTPTGGTGLVWVLSVSDNVGNTNGAPAYIWTAKATAANAGVTITVPFAGGTGWGGVSVNRWKNAFGIGAAISANNAAGSGVPSVAITTTQANSAIDVVSVDWNAVDGASRVWLTVNSFTPTAGNGELTYARAVSLGTAYGAYWPDAGAAGSKTVGLSAPGGQRFAICAVEVFGANEWRLTLEGIGQAVGDTLDEALYVAGPLDNLTGFNAVPTPGTGILTISSVNVAQGSRSLLVQTNTSGTSYVEMDDSALKLIRYYSTYLYIPSASGSPLSNWDFIQCRDASTRVRCRITASRFLAVVNGSTQVAVGAVALPFDTLLRVVFRVRYEAVTGSLDAVVYNGNSTTVITSVSATTIATGAALGTNTRVGVPIQAGATAGPWYFDDIRANDAMDPGPSATVLVPLGTPKVKVWNGSTWVVVNKIDYFDGTAMKTARVRPYL
jgi:hypothetical protein